MTPRTYDLIKKTWPGYFNDKDYLAASKKPWFWGLFSRWHCKQAMRVVELMVPTGSSCPKHKQEYHASASLYYLVCACDSCDYWVEVDCR